MKQRLLGAIILAALLVIFVPELLDGAGHKARFTKQLQIPAEPVFQPMPALADEHPATSSSIVKKVPEVPLVKTIKTPAKQQHKPIKKSTEKAILNAWVLQVGSFNDKANAELFRDKLRAESYAAFIDVKKLPGKKVWRVRVGPELIKSRLEKIRKRINTQYKIDSMIIKHE